MIDYVQQREPEKNRILINDGFLKKLLQHRNILIFSGLFVLMNLIGLDRSGVVWIDEVTLNDPAKELALHGIFRSAVFSGFDGFERTYLWMPPVHPLTTAFVYKVFGFGIWQTRVPVVLFGALTVVAFYFVALHFLDNKRASFFSTLLFAFNPQFIHTVRSGRMDAQCLFFALIGILLFLQSSSGRNTSRYVCFAGISIGLAGMTHPIAIVWAIAIAGSILFLYRENKWRSLTLFCTFSLLPVIAWLVFALQTPTEFKAQFFSIISDHTAQGSILARMVDECRRYGIVYRAVPVLLIFLSAGLLWYILKFRDDVQKRSQLLMLFAVPFVFITFFMTKSSGSWFYILHPISMLMIMIGAMVDSVLSKDFKVVLPKSFKRIGTAREKIFLFAAMLLLLNLILVGIGARYLVLAYQWKERDYATIEEPIRALIPRGSIIFGAPEVWYAAEKIGASLRVRGTPDSHIHDFVITKLTDTVSVIPGFQKIAEIGKPFPPVFGRYQFSPADYQMVLWKAGRHESLPPTP